MNKIPNYTLVVGVDKKHLEQLALVWPTWKRYKFEFLERPFLIFYDESVNGKDIVSIIGNHPYLQIVRWPPPGVDYEGGDDKWTNQQRYRMLSGFVHVPAQYVSTPYWLKLDTDTVATGHPAWIYSSWFEYKPAIVSQPWGYTKPPDQMLKLDAWVNQNSHILPSCLVEKPDLNMFPKPGDNKLKHPRIISWCSFYATNFTQWVACLARITCGIGKLPVPSQDGYVWYMARRMRYVVERPSFKKLGWEHHSSMNGIKERVNEVLYAKGN